MEETMISLINQYGYLGICLLICIENIFPPIPSEVVLLFGGFMTGQTSMQPVFVILAATVGSVLGAILLYLLGRILKKERLKKLFAGKFGKTLRLKPEHVDMADHWFTKYEKKAVLICRCIPIVRSLISVPAGISNMNFPIFLLLTTLGSAVWNTVLVYLGVFMGDAWESVLPYFSDYTIIVVVLIVLAVLGFGIYQWRKHRKASQKNEEKKDAEQD